METFTLTLFFLIYINAMAVMVNFHHFPAVIGALFPALLLIPFIRNVFMPRNRWMINSVLMLMFVFLLVQAVGGIFSYRPDAALDRIITFLLEGIVIYFLTVNLVRTPRMLKLTIGAVALAGLFMGGLSFYQDMTRTYDNNYWGFAQAGATIGTGQETVSGEILKPRMTGPIGEENRYGQILATTAPLALFLGFGVRSKILKILMLAAGFFIVVGSLLTYSRGALIALAFGAIAMLALRYINLRYLAVLPALVVLASLAVPNLTDRLVDLQTISPQMIASTGNAMESLATADGSVRGRATEMLAALNMFADYPLFGVGSGNYPYHYYEYASEVGGRIHLTNRQAHTLYGGIAAENGFFGLATFLLIMAVTFIGLLKARKRWLPVDSLMASIVAGLVIALIVYLVSGIFLHFAYIRYIWFVMGLAGAAAAIQPLQGVPERGSAE